MVNVTQEHVPTSDMEQDEPGVLNVAGPSIMKTVSPKEKVCFS